VVNGEKTPCRHEAMQGKTEWDVGQEKAIYFN
jgi:hypothetical protein